MSFLTYYPRGCDIINANEGFEIEPPEHDGGQFPFLRDVDPNMDAAWTKYIMEFELPKDLQNLLLVYTIPLVNLAAKSNIKEKAIVNHLDEYDLIWQRYKIFLRKGRYEPKLFVISEIIREAFELQLTRGVDGWQGNLLFTRKYEIMQNTKDKKQGRLGKFLQRKDKEQEMY